MSYLIVYKSRSHALPLPTVLQGEGGVGFKGSGTLKLGKFKSRQSLE